MYKGTLIREQAEFLKKQCRPKGIWPVFKAPEEKKKSKLGILCPSKLQK